MLKTDVFKDFVSIILIVGFFIAANLSIMEYHELAHEQIMAYHSCKVISEGGGWDQGRFVEYRQCEVYGPRSEEERLQEIKLHSWNDVIYYAVQGILSYLIFMVLLLYAARRNK